MSPSFVARKNLQRFLIALFGCLAVVADAQPNGPAPSPAAQVVTDVPCAINAWGAPGCAQPDLADLKFREFFRLPVGAYGLEPSEKLVALVGKKVRIVGFMARQETPMHDVFILSPVPVTLGDEDESLADDLPAAVVFVHAVGQEGRTIRFFPGLLRLSGTLSLGPQEESDGHVSTVRLHLDPELTALMLASQPQN